MKPLMKQLLLILCTFQLFTGSYFSQAYCFRAPCPPQLRQQAPDSFSRTNQWRGRSPPSSFYESCNGSYEREFF